MAKAAKFWPKSTQFELAAGPKTLLEMLSWVFRNRRRLLVIYGPIAPLSLPSSNQEATAADALAQAEDLSPALPSAPTASSIQSAEQASQQQWDQLEGLFPELSSDPTAELAPGPMVEAPQKRSRPAHAPGTLLRRQRWTSIIPMEPYGFSPVGADSSTDFGTDAANRADLDSPEDDEGFEPEDLYFLE